MNNASLGRGSQDVLGVARPADMGDGIVGGWGLAFGRCEGLCGGGGRVDLASVHDLEGVCSTENDTVLDCGEDEVRTGAERDGRRAGVPVHLCKVHVENKSKVVR